MSELSEKERIAILQKEEKNRAIFASMKNILSLIDLTNTKTQTYQTYSKDSLRTYLQNPASETNQKNLRKLSEFLFTVSHVYRRLILNKANQLTCKNWTAYPKLNDNGEVEESSYQNYIKTCNYVENMKMHTQIRKCLIKAWLNDVVFAFCYGNPEEGTFFMHILPTDYCKISSQNFYGGVPHFAFDFSYFTGSNAYYLDVFDPVFKKMYNKYQSDSSLRWQELPIEQTFCMKINDYNMDYPVPPLSGMFNSLIDLVDLSQIQSIKDELSAYKLIWGKLETISGSKEVDDFNVDLQLAGDFMAKLQGVIPEDISVALSPMDLGVIDFATNTAEDTNIVNKALSQLLETNGDIVLNSNRITNSASFQMAMLAESMTAMAPVTQINNWINLFIRNNLGIEDVVVEFSDVSKYFEQNRIDQLLKLGQYGTPVKLELISIAGLNPVKCKSMEYLEEKLGLSKTTWITPLVSSNTQSGLSENGDGGEGRPVVDNPSDLSDEGQKSRDKK